MVEDKKQCFCIVDDKKQIFTRCLLNARGSIRTRSNLPTEKKTSVAHKFSLPRFNGNFVQIKHLRAAVDVKIGGGFFILILWLRQEGIQN